MGRRLRRVPGTCQERSKRLRKHVQNVFMGDRASVEGNVPASRRGEDVLPEFCHSVRNKGIEPKKAVVQIAEPRVNEQICEII